MSPALDCEALSYTRFSQCAVAAVGTRSRAVMGRRMLPVRNGVRAELQLWHEQFDSRHGQRLWRAARLCHLQSCLVSDYPSTLWWWFKGLEPKQEPKQLPNHSTQPA